MTEKSKGYNTIKKISNSLEYGFLIRTHQASLLDISLACFLQLWAFNKNYNMFCKLSLAVAIISFIYYILSFFQFFKILNFSSDEETQSKYKALIEDQKIDSFFQRNITVLTMLKKFTMAAIMVFFHDYPLVECVLLSIIFFVATIVVIYSRPFEKPIANFLIILSNIIFFISMVLITILCYISSNEKLVVDQKVVELKLNLGWACISLISFMLIVYVVIYFKEQIEAIKKFIRMSKEKSKALLNYLKGNKGYVDPRFLKKIESYEDKNKNQNNNDIKSDLSTYLAKVKDKKKSNTEYKSQDTLIEMKKRESEKNKKLVENKKLEESKEDENKKKLKYQEYQNEKNIPEEKNENNNKIYLKYKEPESSNKKKKVAPVMETIENVGIDENLMFQILQMKNKIEEKLEEENKNEKIEIKDNNDVLEENKKNNEKDYSDEYEEKKDLNVEDKNEKDFHEEMEYEDEEEVEDEENENEKIEKNKLKSEEENEKDYYDDDDEEMNYEDEEAENQEVENLEKKKS